MHLGVQELMLILVIVLILFGGKKVSGLGKALGTSLREFKEEVNKADDVVKEAAEPIKDVGTQAAAEVKGEAKTETK